MACQQEPSKPRCDVELVQHHATASTLYFQTEASEQVSVDIRFLDEAFSYIETESSTEHEIPLLGLLPYTVVGYQITGPSIDCRGEISPLSLPPSAPELTVEIYDSSRMSSEKYWLGVAVSIEKGATPFSIDRNGQYRWLREGRPDRIGGQIEFLKNSRAVIFNSFATDFSFDSGLLKVVSLQGETLETKGAQWSHHVFTQLPDGTLAYPAVDIREWIDPETEVAVNVIGDKIVEQQPDGTIETVFSAWDWKDVKKHDQWGTAFYGNAHDWTHANSLQYIPERDSYLISFPHLDTILEVDRSSGDVTTEISPEGDILLSDEFNHPHDVHLTEDGLLRLVSHEETQTIAKEFSINEDTLQLEWSYGEGLGITGTVLGQFREMENGNRLINFGGAGVMHEVTSNGTLVWSLSSELGYWLGNGVWFNDFYEGEIE